MSRFFSVVLFVAGFGNLVAQEQLGLRLDNYSGIQTSFLNPSHSSNLPLKWTVNLAGMGIFLDNTYAYIGNASTYKLITQSEKIKLITDYKKSQPPADAMVVDFYRNFKNAFVDFQTKINGPAVSVRLGQHTVGVFYNANFRFEAPQIPQSLNFHTLDDLPNAAVITVHSAQTRMLAWDEFGLNYAYKWETDRGKFQVGANLKYLSGFEGAYLQSVGALGFSRLSKETLRFGKPDASLGYTTGNFNNLANNTYQLQRQGKGTGMDLGFSWIISEDDDTYQYRFSAALLDIGKITFTPTAAQHYANNIKGDNYNLTAQLDAVKTLGEGVAKLTEIATGDSLNTKKSDIFAIAMPMSICLMADYQFFPKTFATFIFQQRIRQQDSPLHRGNLIAANIRYEHRWFSASIPVSVYNYKHMKAGLAGRLGFVTVGTDDLFSWVKKKEWTGTDFYVAVLINPFNLSFPGLNLNRNRGRNIKCFRF
ncbi:MAG: DUF5723 family protein [Saprospiraceae bacterium]